MTFEPTDFKQAMDVRKEFIDRVLADYLLQLELPDFIGINELRKSVEYSLLSGGKRFRPTLCLMLAEAFGVGPQRILAFASAIEMIHTYSLIHDDLPAMDNDDYRRGEPTNHKVFGEATALLAGDALLTEAFGLIANAYLGEPQVAVDLISLLSKAAGLHGMVGGQALDMRAKNNLSDLESLTLMHSMKTGALIRVCCEGTAVACGLPEEKVKLCRDFGVELGLAFQLADDLIDSKDGNLEKGSIPEVIGLDETRRFLQMTSQRAKEVLATLGIHAGHLHELVEYNQVRAN